VGPVGIIGFGTFGRFMAQQLSPYTEVLVSSRRPVPAAEAQAVGARVAELEEVAAQPVVVPSVPVQNLESVLEQLRPHLRLGTLVADVSSVTERPVAMMQRLVPAQCEILATHPLFGPQSGANGIAGLPMVLWPVRIGPERLDQIRLFLGETLQLNVMEISPEEHDQEMAYVHALTYLLGRAFSEIDIPNTPLRTATYQHLLDVRRLVELDTPELFETIQHYNPYAAQMRQRFAERLNAIEGQLERNLSH
jgi:prephenate dehydrogenase